MANEMEKNILIQRCQKIIAEMEKLESGSMILESKMNTLTNEQFNLLHKLKRFSHSKPNNNLKQMLAQVNRKIMEGQSEFHRLESRSKILQVEKDDILKIIAAEYAGDPLFYRETNSG